MTIKRLIAVLAVLILLLTQGAALAVEDGFHTSYTYNYDYWGDIRESPDAYQVESVIYSQTLGL